MRIFRLAQIFEQKYRLISQSQSISNLSEIVEKIRSELASSYRTWLSPEAKDESVSYWARMGHEPSKELLKLMKDLSEDTDFSPVQLFNRINSCFKLTQVIKSDLGHFKDKVKDKINGLTHPMVNELNYRESKARTAIRMVEHTLEKQGRTLLRLQPKTELVGGYEDQKRKPLTRRSLETFMHSLAAQTYGLDNMYVVEQILFYPETKEMLTTLINAINRGHYPVDGAEMTKATAVIKAWLDDKQQTNVPALAELPEKPADPIFEEEGK